MKMRKFGPRYGFKKFGKGGATTPPNPMDDLAPRGNLPTKEDLKPPKDAPPPKKNPPPEPPMTEKEKQILREAEQAKKDKKSRDAYERFQKSPENDSPGYNKGGLMKKYATGGMPMPGMSTKPKPTPKPEPLPIKPQPIAPKPMPRPTPPKPGMSMKPQPVETFPDRGRPGRNPIGEAKPSNKPVNRAMMKSGGSVSSASKRADGCAVKGKTKGRFV